MLRDFLDKTEIDALDALQSDGFRSSSARLLIFKAIMQGRTDYENMLPMTIGIKKTKVYNNIDASGGKNCSKRLFLSLDVKIDNLQV